LRDVTINDGLRFSSMLSIHSYHHRFGNAPSDLALEAIEQRAGAWPPITVPAATRPPKPQRGLLGGHNP
jgi:hypothetical protein